MKHMANTSNAEFYLSADDVMDTGTLTLLWLRE